MPVVDDFLVFGVKVRTITEDNGHVTVGCEKMEENKRKKLAKYLAMEGLIPSQACQEPPEDERW